MKRSLLTGMLLVCFYLGSRSQNTDSIYISGEFGNRTIKEALEIIAQVIPYRFSYQSNLPGLQKIINSKPFIKKPLKNALDGILENSGLQYKIYAGQIVIYVTAPLKTCNILIEGKLVRAGSDEPVAFAGIELYSARKGTISDVSGYFRMEVDAARINDTLKISALNYFPVKVLVSNFNIPGNHTFYLKERTIELATLNVVAEKSRLNRIGNKPLFASGSFYLDTHGQQTALFIENENRDSGKIVSLNIYLSKRGNTDAPFRLHLYLPDSTSGKPGIELLPEMIIIKPASGKGWYSVNLSKYHIPMPTQGFFVAVEGIFPGDFDFFYDNGTQTFNNTSDEPADDFDGETISYGQQIGYSGGSENKTWHYSIDGNWFQLKKKHFNAMIYVEFSIPKSTIKHGFWSWFKRKNKR